MQKAASLAGYFLNLGINERKSKAVHMTKSCIVFDVMGVIKVQRKLFAVIDMIRQILH